jgi:ubiquinone/menaquinone biosynthesis C-methylase UbiE
VTDTLFAGSIPELYDRLLVPMLFEPYARDLAERVTASKPRHVLETCAGTGALTREIASRLSADARLVATDLNQPMLDKAIARVSHDRVTSKQADALALPFEDRTFDVVTCQFGVMFFPDKTRGYAEACRVLKPGGALLFNVWDKLSANELSDVVTEAVATMFPQDPPRFMARTPHGYHDIARIRDELASAGLINVGISAVENTSRAASARDAAIAICQGTPLRNEIEARDASRLDEATRCATEALERRFGAGPIEAPMRAFVISAESPR